MAVMMVTATVMMVMVAEEVVKMILVMTVMV